MDASDGLSHCTQQVISNREGETPGEDSILVPHYPQDSAFGQAFPINDAAAMFGCDGWAGFIGM
jgi:hypothetical protein